MLSHWDQIVAEFDQMGPRDQLRAISKAQIEWLAGVAESVPSKYALDLGFGCGMSAIAMAMGGCNVTSINYEPANTPRRVEAEKRYTRVCLREPTIIEAPTDRALSRLRDEGREFGLIFVDAGHRFDDVFVDVHHSKYLCVPGGVLALDDTYYGPIRTVANWIISNLGHIWEPYQILENTISWKRTAAPVDDWMQDITHRRHDGPAKPFEVAGENADQYLYYPSETEATKYGFTVWHPTVR